MLVAPTYQVADCYLMANTKLIPYWITVREIQEPNKPWDQTQLQRHESDFPRNNLADYFHEFLLEYAAEDEVYVDKTDEKTFTVQEPIRRDGNTIEGRLKSGEYGQNADFWDIDKHERIEDARQENHAEEIPYYFLFHIPDHDRSQALLILSTYKRKGVKTVFEDVFIKGTRRKDIGDAYIEIEPHYSDKVLEEINDADSIASIRFRGKDLIPARDQYADRNSVERTGKEISGVMDVGTELKLTPQGNQSAFREFVKSLLPGEENPHFEYGRLHSEDFDTANVTVVEGESQLTFSLWEEQIQMRMDVDPDEYDLDIYGGYPTPYSLGCVARQLANDLMGDFDSDIPTESLIPRPVGIPDEEEVQAPPVDD